MRRTAKLGVAVSALIALPLGVAAVPAGASVIGESDTAADCAIERLPLPAGVDDAEVTKGDPTGRYLIGESDDRSGYLLWVDGEVDEFPDAPDITGWYPSDVNSSGVFAGSGYAGDFERAVRYADGEYTVLPQPDNLENATALGVNENGDIVGFGYNMETPTFEKTPLYWPADQPETVRVLEGPDPQKADVSAFDIGDNGAVIGDWYGYPSGGGSYLWPDVDSEPRPLLGSDGRDDASPFDARGNLAFGWDSDHPRGVVWDLETGEVSATYKKFLDSVNADGDVSFEDNWPAIVARSDGGFVKLASLGGELPRNASVLFDRGHDLVAAGKARDENRTWQPVVWRGC